MTEDTISYGVQNNIATIFIKLSKILYLPIARIKTQIPNKRIIVHCPKKSNPKRFSKKPAVTNPTAPVIKNIDAIVMRKYIHNTGFPSFLYPSIMLV